MSKKPKMQVPAVTPADMTPSGSEVYVLAIKPDPASGTAYHDVRRAVEYLERAGHTVEWRSV